MPVVPNALERFMLLRLGAASPATLDVFGAATLRAAVAAIELGIFDALRGRTRTLEELAEVTGSQPRPLGALLEVLRTTRYLEHHGDDWRLSAMSEKWLADPQTGTPSFLRNWAGVIFDLWSDLVPAVRDGTPRRHLHDWLAAKPERWPIFNAAMIEIARSGADELAQKAELPASAARLIDIGGNHAIDAIAFCRRFPHLRATVFDLPEAFGDAPRRVREAGLADRIVFQAGDFARGPLGSGYDAALLLNVLHYQGAEANVELLRKVREALNAGGRIVILEQLGDASRLPIVRTFIAIFDLLCVTAMGGGVHSFEDITAWLGRAGYRDIRRTALRKTPGSALIEAARR